MARFGLKLGVHEADLASVAEELWRAGRYDFLELYVPRDARPEQADLWRWYDGFLVLHAPHAAAGFNFARPELATDNFRALELMEALRARLRPAMAVFHPGLDGDVGETLQRVGALRRAFPELHRVMLLENKPRLGMNGEQCLGSSPLEMRALLAETGCGFCLDLRHAYAYAAWAGRKWREVLEEFVDLKPRLWHAADGDVAGVVDSHGHIGEGNMPWAELGAFWDADSPVTIECRKEPALRLVDFLEDMETLRRLSGTDGIRLRPAEPGDMELFWKLANDPATRANSYNTAAIPIAQHEAWFTEQLRNPLRLLYVGETMEGRPVGVVRFTGSGDGTWEIGITVADEWRGRGVGTRLVEKGVRVLADSGGMGDVHAWVKSSNAASIRMFVKAGFQIVKNDVTHKGCVSTLLVASNTDGGV